MKSLSGRGVLDASRSSKPGAPNYELLMNERRKKPRDYSTKDLSSFFFTGAFLSVTYWGRPSR